MLNFAQSKMKQGEATKSLPAFADFCGSKKDKGKALEKEFFMFYAPRSVNFIITGL